MSQSKIVMAGVPRAGKTTYLALLYLGITERLRTSISLGSYQDDREYLNSLVERLIQCEDAVHTDVGRLDGLGLSVLLPDGSQTMLTMPDLSGETWQEALSDRTWTPDLRDQVLGADGICVFVNVGDFLDDIPIAQADQADRAAGAPSEAMTEGFQHVDQGQSAQVQLADLLQIIGETPTRVNRRVSLVLSAYDLVEGLTPAEWLRMSAPLLEQYFAMNRGWLELRVFGLSAQGGSFQVATSRKKLLKRQPLERAFVVDQNGEPAQFDDPVLWAMSLG